MSGNRQMMPFLFSFTGDGRKFQVIEKGKFSVPALNVSRNNVFRCNGMPVKFT
jgi:hypothetical protein